MSELDAALQRIRGHNGVDHLILLGHDGLVVQHIGGGGNEEPIAARIPGLAAACGALGTAAGTGRFQTAVIEFDSGVAIITSLSGDLLLLAMIRPGVGFAPLLRELRRQRSQLVELL
jgi:predicted regulator of Ras-like GTPase activity (Roadblock/LC7/MglB family)